jgi:hypothetical protein
MYKLIRYNDFKNNIVNKQFNKNAFFPFTIIIIFLILKLKQKFHVF